MLPAIQTHPFSLPLDHQLGSSLFGQLPMELIFDILYSAGRENFQSLTRIRGTCQKLYQMIENRNLWERIYELNFPRYPKPNPTEFIEAYSTVCRNESNVIKGVYKLTPLGTADSFSAVSIFMFTHESLITGSQDAIRVYDFATGECSQILEETHPHQIAGFRIADGMLMSYYMDQTVKIWDVEAEECIYIQKNDQVCEKFIVSDEKLFCGFADGSITIQDAKTGKCLSKLTGHKAAICALASFEGKLFSGDQKGTIKVWEEESGKCLHTIKDVRYFGEVDAFHFFRGIFFAGLNDHPAIWSWGIETGQLLGVFQDNQKVKYFAVNGDKLISFSGDSSIKVWDIKTQKCLGSFNHHEPLIDHIDVIEEKLFLFKSDGGIFIFDFLVDDISVLRQLYKNIKSCEGNIKEIKDRFFRMPKKIQNQILLPGELNGLNDADGCVLLAQAIADFFERLESFYTAYDILSSDDEWEDGESPSKKQRTT